MRRLPWVNVLDKTEEGGKENRKMRYKEIKRPQPRLFTSDTDTENLLS
jgi:hypothetical protein